VAGGWRGLHVEELHNLYTSQNIIRVIKSRTLRLVRHVERMEIVRNVHKVLVGKTEGKRPLGRARRRWGDNIRLDLKEVGWKGVNWSHLAEDRVQWRVMNLRVP
jgi:hypothetical protein